MSSKELLDNNQTSEQKIKELAIHMDRVEREYQVLLNELGLTAQELKEYAEDQENFSPPIWELLVEEKQKIDQELEMNLANIPNPDKLKKCRSEQKEIRSHWLFVR